MVDTAAIAEAEDAAQLPYDTSDPKQVNTARKKAARKTRTSLEFVQAMMDVPEGRAWMYDLLGTKCHCFETSFVQGDPHATSFREGERNVGARILADVMRVSPKEYVTMCEEGHARG